MYDYFKLSIVTEIEHALLLFQLSMECFKKDQILFL